VNATIHPLVAGYLRSLDGAAKVLPRREREELVGEIRAHIDQAITPDSSEADVRNVLDSLGTPWDIVAAAGGETRSVRRGPREIFALLLLLTGFPPFIGWVVGLGLLIWSPLWTVRQKLLFALVWPGGLLNLVLFFGVSASSTARVCSGGACVNTGGMNQLWWLVIVPVFIAPFLVAGYMWQAAGRRSAQ
jgi:hypothetical protein